MGATLHAKQVRMARCRACLATLCPLRACPALCTMPACDAGAALNRRACAQLVIVAFYGAW